MRLEPLLGELGARPAKRSTLPILVGVIVLALLSQGCSPPTPAPGEIVARATLQADSKEPIVIGLVTEVTGALASFSSRS